MFADPELKLVLCVALAAAFACAAPQVVTLDGEARFVEEAKRVQPGCLLATGELPDVQGARVRIVAGDVRVDALAVCDRTQQRVLLTRVAPLTLVFFRAGRFVAAHPSDTTAKSEAASGRAALFADPHPDGTVEDVLRALEGFRARLTYVLWDPGA